MQCPFLVLFIVDDNHVNVNKDVLRHLDSLVIDGPRVYFQIHVPGIIYNEEHDVLDSRVLERGRGIISLIS